MFRIAAILMLMASPVSAQVMLGPSGVPSTEPFPLITEEYENDFKAAKKCELLSFEGGMVFEGELAFYHQKKDGEVEVLVDEFARRYAIDYCWI